MPDPHLAGPVQRAITAHLDTYLSEVAQRLAGPRRIRAAIIDELRDGLTTDVLTRCARGAEPEEAARAALREFGPPDVVAAAFADELAIARARHTVAAYLATGPLVGLLWVLVIAPPIGAEGPTALWGTVPAAPAAAAAAMTGAIVLVATGRASRRFRVPGHHSIYGALAVITAAAIGDLVMLAHTASSAAFPLSTVAALAVAASATRLGCGVIASLRCLQSMSRHPRGA